MKIFLTFIFAIATNFTQNTHPQPTKTTESIILNRSGIPLFSVYVSAHNPNQNTPTILWMHGACKHSGSLLPSAQLFAQNGFNNILYDLRGHGKSGGYEAHVNSLNELQQDTIDVYEFYRQKITGPLFVVACSAGALISVRTLQTNPQLKLTALFCLAPCLGFNEELLPQYQQSLLPIANIICPKAYAELKIHHKTKYPFEAKKAHDPHELHHVSTRSTYCVYKNCKWAMRDAHKLSCPVHIIIPESDYIVSNKKTHTFYKKIPKKNQKSITILPDMNHSLLEGDGKEIVGLTILTTLKQYLPTTTLS